MDFIETVNQCPLIITEGAVVERIHRESPFSLDPYLANASFIYEPKKQQFLKNIYKQYVDAVKPSNLPMILLTPTWRANRERIKLAGLSDRNVNADCVDFLSQIRDEYGYYSKQIFIGGLIGCKGDSYKPEQALNHNAAAEFHGFQVEALKTAGVDFLIASTLPSVSEAMGIAEVMSQTEKPYILSFVIRSNGTLLDGTLLFDAVSIIDSSTKSKPLGYMINCVHPTVFQEAFTFLLTSNNMFRGRILGLQANTSPKSPEELDGLEELETEEPGNFACLMASLHTDLGLKILGGCCGTDYRHIDALVKKLNI